MSLNSGLKISIAISLTLHILGVALILILPQRDVKKGNPLMARLVTPEEMVTKGDRGFQGLRVPETTGSSRPRLRERRGTEIKEKASSNRGAEVKTEKGRSESGGESDISSAIPPLSQAPSQPSVTPSHPPESPKQIPLLPKERLFDREVVERLAKKEKEEVKPDKGITFDTNELKYYSYMQRLKDRIEGIWRYPPEAAEKGIYGDLYIRFTIKKNGRLGNIELLRTSGYRSLDEAAMKALRDAEPFWPLPDEWKKEDLIITGHFIYSLYGVYLR